MANTSFTYARFFPVEPFDFFEAERIYKFGKEELWRSWFFINKEKSYIDLVFPSKSAINFSLFSDSVILSNFHIWVRVADTGSGEELIGYKSQENSNHQEQISKNAQQRYRFKNWNWVDSALFIADEIEIKFNTKKTVFLDSFVKKHVHNQIDREIKSDLVWNHKGQIIYQKSAQPWLDSDFTNEHLKIDFYNQKFDDVESYIWRHFTSDTQISFDSNFLKQFDLSDEKANYVRVFEAIDSFSLNFNKNTVHRLTWNGINEGWLGTGILDWNNCINPEYIKFKTRYEILAGLAE